MLKLTTDQHKVSRGLSATAELLVLISGLQLCDLSVQCFTLYYSRRFTILTLYSAKTVIVPHRIM